MHWPLALLMVKSIAGRCKDSNFMITPESVDGEQEMERRDCGEAMNLLASLTVSRLHS